MAGLLIFNLLLLLFSIATATRVVPSRLYDGLLRGLHNTIGITTPTDGQLRWTLIAWIISVLVIVDGVVFGLLYIF